MRTVEILTELVDERQRQDAKWGEQNHPMPVWMTVITEEIGEASEAVLKWWFASDYTDKANELANELRIDTIRTELIQVAAVTVAAIESFDRQRKSRLRPER